MIESWENGIQLLGTGFCAGMALWKVLHTGKRAWGLLAVFFGCYFLADLYWFLYLLFMGETPLYYISDLTWYASFLFLILLLRELSTEEERAFRTPLAWIGPVFAAAMTAFYLQWGDVFGNLASGVLMGIMFYQATRGLVFLSHRPKEEAARRSVYVFVLIFCVLEYALWTLSCFWMGDTAANPYFWVDFALTLQIVLLLPAVGKAVRA